MNILKKIDLYLNEASNPLKKKGPIEKLAVALMNNIKEFRNKNLESFISELESIFLPSGGTNKTLLRTLEKNGYNSAGAWEENKEFFNKLGLTKIDYNNIVRKSLK